MKKEAQVLLVEKAPWRRFVTTQDLRMNISVYGSYPILVILQK